MMARLIATEGLPASGKSTWTAQMLAQNPEWVQVERDLIRLELDPEYLRKNFDADFEKRVSTVRDERIIAALKAGKTVICSDTNLNYKTMKGLRELAEKHKAEFQVESFTHVPLEECIRRDALRSEGKRVGEAVIRRMYTQIRPDDPIGRGVKHIVIGDVHGDISRLMNTVTFHKDLGECKFVFLGDLNDPRYSDPDPGSVSSWQCLLMVRSLVNRGQAVLLRSNHQKNLIRWWRGQRKDLSYGLKHTVDEIEWMLARGIISREMINEVIDWLDSLPYWYAFEQGRQTYYCTHAYYTPGMSQYHPKANEESHAIYGLTEGKDRIKWWEMPEYKLPDGIRVAGHYHVFGGFPQSGSILLDSCCGEDGGALTSAYLTDDLFSTFWTV